MTATGSEHKRAALVLSFEPSCLGIMDALLVRATAAGGRVACCDFQLNDGKIGESRCKTRTAEGNWSTPQWASTIDSLADGIEKASAPLLDLEQQLESGNLPDQIDLCFLIGASLEDPALADTLCQAALEAKDRLKRISRAVLLLTRKFKPVGAAAPGMVDWLPLLDPNAFDLVVLLDAMNTEGALVGRPEHKAEQFAAILHALTLGDIAPTLHRQLQARKSSLSQAGQFFSLGWSELDFNPTYVRDTLANCLYRRGALEIKKQMNVEEIGERLHGDSASREIEKTSISSQLSRIGEGLDSFDLMQQMEGQEATKAHAQFEQAEWNLLSLKRFLIERSDIFRHISIHKAKDLALFMERFAPWYTRRQLGLDRGQEPRPYKIATINRRRIVQFLLVSIGFLVSGAYTLLASYPPILLPFAAIATVLFGSGAIFIYRRGWTTEQIVSPRPQENMLEKLRILRDRKWIADELSRLNKMHTASLEKNLTQLSSDAAVEYLPEPGMLPISDEVCSKLLAEHSLEPETFIKTFWRETPHPFDTAVGGQRDSLPIALQAFANNRCRQFSGIHWDNVLASMGGAKAMRKTLLRTCFAKARARSMPWMPVEGKESGIILAMPKTLAPERRQMISKRFPGAETFERDGAEGIVFLQWTQGYLTPDMASEPQATL